MFSSPLIQLGALDATVHTVMANKFGIRGFPTIKYFAPGSDANDAVDYDGGRTTSDIVSWASAKALENLPAPEVVEGTNQQIVEGELLTSSPIIGLLQRFCL